MRLVHNSIAKVAIADATIMFRNPFLMPSMMPASMYIDAIGDDIPDASHAHKPGSDRSDANALLSMHKKPMLMPILMLVSI